MTETRGRTTAPQQPSGDKPAVRQGLFARIALFYRQVIAELRKVVWPTRQQLITYTSVVIVFVTIMIAIVSLLDFVFSKGVLAIFG